MEGCSLRITERGVIKANAQPGTAATTADFDGEQVLPELHILRPGEINAYHSNIHLQSERHA
jgi:hypothetical protein